MSLTIIPAEQQPETATHERVTSPLKAIRAKCLDCQAGSWKRIAECPSTRCSLWPYREGKNPNRRGIGGNPKFKKKTTT